MLTNYHFYVFPQHSVSSSYYSTADISRQVLLESDLEILHWYNYCLTDDNVQFFLDSKVKSQVSVWHQNLKNLI